MPEMHGRGKAVTTSRPYQLLARSVIVPWALQGERPTGEGMEIGAGSGVMTARLLTRFPHLRMVATDFDPEMVDRAGETLAGFGDRAHVERADATDLPFADDRFDLVLSAAMLHHTLEWERAIAEAVRVLRPGGHLVGYDMLESAMARRMHIGEGHDTRLLRKGEMRAQLDRSHLTEVRSRVSLGGLVVRFRATKPA